MLIELKRAGKSVNPAMIVWVEEVDSSTKVKYGDRLVPGEKTYLINFANDDVLPIDDIDYHHLMNMMNEASGRSRR